MSAGYGVEPYTFWLAASGGRSPYSAKSSPAIAPATLSNSGAPASPKPRNRIAPCLSNHASTENGQKIEILGDGQQIVVDEAGLDELGHIDGSPPHRPQAGRLGPCFAHR